MKHFIQISIKFSLLLALPSLCLIQVSALAESFVLDSKMSEEYEVTQPTGNFGDNIVLYPNPCSNYLNISLNGGDTIDRIAVSDMLGNLVWEQRKFENSELLNFQIPVFELKNGIYFVEIESGNQRITRKISKE